MDFGGEGRIEYYKYKYDDNTELDNHSYYVYTKEYLTENFIIADELSKVIHQYNSGLLS